MIYAKRIFDRRLKHLVRAATSLNRARGAPTLDQTALISAVVGTVGAVIGTLGGRAARAALARTFGSDRPAALLEDAIAIGAALLVVRAFV